MFGTTEVSENVVVVGEPSGVVDPFRYTWYPVTPVLSALAVHTKSTWVGPGAAAVSTDGVEGASESPGLAGVVTAARFDRADWLPAASTAVTS